MPPGCGQCIRGFIQNVQTSSHDTVLKINYEQKVKNQKINVTDFKQIKYSHTWKAQKVLNALKVSSMVIINCSQLVFKKFQSPDFPHLKVLHHVQSFCVDFIFRSFRFIDHRSQVPDIGVIKVPLIVRVVLKHFEALADPLVHTHQPEKDLQD